jgi:hypothetical protein
MILLVVLVFLTLFAIIGVTLVLYADAHATSSRLYAEAHSRSRPEADPELLFAYFLGQLIYDTSDDEHGVFSGLRGHSLARNMFGLNYLVYPDGSVVLGKNDVPFNGIGRLHYPSPFNALDDSYLVNYTYFAADGFLRDPERFGPRAGFRPPGTPDNRAPYLGGCNAPYTYPDLNNLFRGSSRRGRACSPTAPGWPRGPCSCPPSIGPGSSSG